MFSASCVVREKATCSGAGSGAALLIVCSTAALERRSIGRATQGVRLLGVEEGDQVVSVARLAEREGEENGVAETAEVPPAPETPNQ